MTILPDNNETRLLAISQLELGSVIAYPTDTVYGLGVDTLNSQSVVRLFEIKKRDIGIAVPVLIGSMDQLLNVATDIPYEAYKLAEKFWPGPLTMILKKNPQIPEQVTAGESTIAVRIPNHPCALQLSLAFEAGIIGTSANIHGEPSTLNASEVNQQIGMHIDLILDGGHARSDQSSTIINLVDKNFPVLREGAIQRSVLESTIALFETESEN